MQEDPTIVPIRQPTQPTKRGPARLGAAALALALALPGAGGAQSRGVGDHVDVTAVAVEGSSAADFFHCESQGLEVLVGHRVCLGQRFGLTEAILCLAILAQRFDLELEAGRNVEVSCRLTLRPEGGLPMLVRTRHGRTTAPPETAAP